MSEKLDHDYCYAFYNRLLALMKHSEIIGNRQGRDIVLRVPGSHPTLVQTVHKVLQSEGLKYSGAGDDSGKIVFYVTIPDPPTDTESNKLGHETFDENQQYLKRRRVWEYVKSQLPKVTWSSNCTQHNFRIYTEAKDSQVIGPCLMRLMDAGAVNDYESCPRDKTNVIWKVYLNPDFKVGGSDSDSPNIAPSKKVHDHHQQAAFNVWHHNEIMDRKKDAQLKASFNEEVSKAWVSRAREILEEYPNLTNKQLLEFKEHKEQWKTQVSSGKPVAFKPLGNAEEKETYAGTKAVFAVDGVPCPVDEDTPTEIEERFSAFVWMAFGDNKVVSLATDKDWWTGTVVGEYDATGAGTKAITEKVGKKLKSSLFRIELSKGKFTVSAPREVWEAAFGEQPVNPNFDAVGPSYRATHNDNRGMNYYRKFIVFDADGVASLVEEKPDVGFYFGIRNDGSVDICRQDKYGSLFQSKWIDPDKLILALQLAKEYVDSKVDK